MNKISKMIGICVAIVFVFLAFKPFKIVSADSMGLKFTLGKLQDKTLNPGFHLKVPLVQSIKTLSLRPMQEDMTVEVGPQGAITQDNQTVGASLTAFYRYDPAQLVEMWEKYGESQIESLLRTGMFESFKSVLGTYDIFNVAANQVKIQSGVFTDLVNKMSKYPIVITEVRIKNYDWSDAFDAQIEKTMAMAQQVRQKQQDLEIKNLEAQKVVKVAESTKQETILLAEGRKEAARLDAEAKILEGEGIRKYNESIERTKELELEFRRLEIAKLEKEKWNGQYVPTNNYGPIPVQTGSIQPAE